MFVPEGFAPLFVAREHLGTDRLLRELAAGRVTARWWHDSGRMEAIPACEWQRQRGQWGLHLIKNGCLAWKRVSPRPGAVIVIELPYSDQTANEPSSRAMTQTEKSEAQQFLIETPDRTREQQKANLKEMYPHMTESQWRELIKGTGQRQPGRKS